MKQHNTAALYGGLRALKCRCVCRNPPLAYVVDRISKNPISLKLRSGSIYVPLQDQILQPTASRAMLAS